MNKSPNRDLTGKTIKLVTKTKIETVFEKIRQNILCGHHMPEAKLRVEHLSREYGVSSSTIREALSRLISESLVLIENKRGFKVAGVSKEDFHEIIEMRKLLEVNAVQTSIATGDEEWENGIISSFYRLTKLEENLSSKQLMGRAEKAEEWSHLNKKFHDALIGACGNKWLMDTRRKLHDHFERYLLLFKANGDENRYVHDEHKCIYDAVLNRDAELAGKLLGDHIDRSLETIM